MQKWYLALVLAFGTMLIGCLGDDVLIETKPRVILQPDRVMFKAVGTSDLMAQWSPSPTDTQTNFKGYYIELYTSIDTVGIDIDLTLVDLIATAHTPKSDTFYVFQNIPVGRYTLRVFGEREPDPTNPDSVVKSKFPTELSFSFDPTPVVAPAELLAHSVGESMIDLRWLPSASVNQPGMVGYVVRYRDNSTINSPIYTYPSRPGKGDTVAITLPSIQLPKTFTGEELPYKIWVKAVRNDSTESADSAVIIWSGAKPLGPISIDSGKRIFIGQGNLTYEMKQADGAPAQIGVTAIDSIVTLEAFEGAKFVNRVDVANFDDVFFTEPFKDSAYTETTLTLPRKPGFDGAWVYVLFSTGARARLVFFRDGTNGTLIHNGNQSGSAVRVQAKFQPHIAPHFLPYF